MISKFMTDKNVIWNIYIQINKIRSSVSIYFKYLKQKVC